MKRFVLALILALACSAQSFAQKNVHVFQSGPSAIAEQIVVLKDGTRPVVVGDLQTKYQRVTKPYVYVFDHRENSRTTKAYVSKKPPTAAYPYFFVVAKDGLILAQGEVQETTEANVAVVEKFQAKAKAADAPARAVMLQAPSGKIVGGIVYINAVQYTVRDVSIVKLPGPIDTITTKVTKVTYVYEKDMTFVPTQVSHALQRINAESGGLIVATEFEEDSTVDGKPNGRVPSQYVIALKAAQDAGLPALVVQSGDIVVRVVKAPTTEAAVMEAAK